MSTTANANPNPTPQRSDPGLDEELPPAYTPSADVYSGEQTVEYGPSRPFQQAPAPASHRPAAAPPTNFQSNYYPQQTAQQTGSSSSSGRTGLSSLWNTLAEQLQEIASRSSSTSHHPPGGRLTPQPTGGSWSSYPGRVPQPQSYAPPAGPPPPRRFVAPPPPPRHPNSVSSPAIAPTHTGDARPPPVTATSDFARDFYAAGAEIPGENPSTELVDEFGAAPAPAPVAAGKPTTTPTPGHPYLHNNQLLVYPKGYECEKCHNIGYKLPSLKPCKRCWPKYAKDFTGPLAYSFSNSTSTSETTPETVASNNFQRPLPNPPPVGNPRWTSSAARNSYPGALPNLLTPQPSGTRRELAIASGSNAYVPPRGPVCGYQPGNRPPGCGVGRGACGPSVVYTAGDPRLGGRRCWRCDGEGTVSFMLFDREQCSVCGGIGRTFN